LEEKNAKIEDFKGRISTLITTNEYDMKLESRKHEEIINAMQVRFNQEIEKEKSRYRSLLDEVEEERRDNEEKIKIIEEKHSAATEQVETVHLKEAKKNDEIRNFLIKEKDEIASHNEEHHTMLVAQHDQVLTELTEEYEHKT